MMRLPPLVRSLSRHKLTVFLMVLATALTSAIVTNAALMVVGRLVLLDAPSGLDESHLVLFDSSLAMTPEPGDAKASRTAWSTRYKTDVATLRGIDGVEAAAVVSGLPFYGGSAFDITSEAGAPKGRGFQVTGYAGGPGVLETLGLHLVAGRGFRPSEFVHSETSGRTGKVSVTIISRALARRLFHGDDALGRQVYVSGQPIRIVGVVGHLMSMNPRLGAIGNEYAMLLPSVPDEDNVIFAMRVTPSSQTHVLREAVATLAERNPRRVFSDAGTFAQLRAEYFRRDSAMVGLLLAAGFSLLIVTAAGIAGLSSFWVQQRTRSIGIRRALGATPALILRYFQAENFLIVSGGVLLGCFLAYGLNLFLLRHYEVQALPAGFLLAGALAIWLIGQIAVLGPALRVAAVPPAVAARSE